MSADNQAFAKKGATIFNAASGAQGPFRVFRAMADGTVISAITASGVAGAALLVGETLNKGDEVVGLIESVTISAGLGYGAAPV